MRRAAALAAVALGFAVVPAAAQETSLWLDASAAHSRPPSGAAIDPANYGLLGARLRMDRRGSGLELGAHGGRGAADGTGSWAGGSASGEWFNASGILSWGARAGLSGVRYLEPVRTGEFEFSQSHWLGSASPHVGLSLGGFLLRAEAQLTRGGWASETTTGALPAPGGGVIPIGGGGSPTASTEELSGPIAVTGGALALNRMFGAATLELRAERYDAENQIASGVYQGAGATLGLGLGPVDASLAVRRWQSPDGAGGTLDETGFHAGLGIPVGERAYAQAAVGRGVSDPVFGSEGSFGLSLGMSVRVGSVDAGAANAPVVVGDAVGGKRRVHFRLRAGAAKAAVAGDFSDWKPQAMRRDGDAWVLELQLEPGVYHFSFVLDDDRWMVPADSPGIVDDGFGRKNATLVVEK